MKKLLLILLIAISLTLWFVTKQPSGPSIVDVKRVGIHAFLGHDIEGSCTFSVLGDAKLSQCTKSSEHGIEVEKHFDESGRLNQQVHRHDGTTTKQVSFDYNDTDGSIVVTSTVSPKQPYKTLISEVCHEKSASDSDLHYECSQSVTPHVGYVPALRRVNKQTLTYHYHANSGTLQVKTTSNPKGAHTRYVFDQLGKLLANQTIFSAREQHEYGHFITYHYVEDDVLMSTATERTSSSWLSRQWASLTSSGGSMLEPPNFSAPSSLKTPRHIAPSHTPPAVFIKVLNWDKQGNPIKVEIGDALNTSKPKRHLVLAPYYRAHSNSP